MLYFSYSHTYELVLIIVCSSQSSTYVEFLTTNQIFGFFQNYFFQNISPQNIYLNYN